MPMRQVYPAENVDDDSLVDIVAVHGLNPRSKDDEEHAWDTWRKPAGKTGRIWLKDDLPERYTTKARIFIWVYNSTLVYGRDRGQFVDKANDLQEALRIERRGDPDRPLIFLAHSLGGILVQQALVNAHNNEYYKSIRTWTTGLAFFGTPHGGGNKSLVALGIVAAGVASLLHLQTPNDVIETLKNGSLFVDLLGEQWRHQLESYQLVSFWEGKSNIVPKKSAIFGLPGTRENIVELNAEHSDLCRYDRSIQDQDNFKLVANNIQDLYEDAIKRTHASPADSAGIQKEQEQFKLMLSLAAAPEIDYFVGRASNLSSIKSVLLPITAPERQIVVLYGLGGIGKSQLAIEHAKQHRDDYTAVFWLNAKTEDTLKRSFVAGAQRLPEHYFDQKLLSGSQNQVALDAIVSGMKKWLDRQGNHRWLLIYDNVDNPRIPDNKRAGAYDIRSYFPQAYQGSILVTTRWKSLSIGHMIEVAKLSNIEDSISLLENTSCTKSRQSTSGHQEDFELMLTIGTDAGLQNIAKQLDGLPLALATAGFYLFQTSMPASEYLQHHNKSWLELQRTSPQLSSYEDQKIYTTWNMSYIHIRKADMSAAKLLEFWAYFDNNDLWYDLLQAGNDDEAPDWFCHILRSELAFEAAVLKLQNHALVQRSKDSHGYSMHHCVHAWVKSVLFKTIEDQSMRLAIACVGNTIVEGPDDWITKRRLLPHSERCLRLTRDWDKEGRAENEICIAQSFGRIGRLHLNLGRLMEAETTIWRAHELFGKVCGSHHMFTLDVASYLPMLYESQGRLPEAESMCVQNLTRYEDILGPDGKFTLSTVGHLGWLYLKQGKVKDAESMSQRALIGFERTLGPNHELTLYAVSTLGTVYAIQNRLEEAESMYLRALIGHERIFGSDHSYTLAIVSSLGILYDKQGKPADAESMCQRALIGQGKTLGPDHRETLRTVINLGALYCRQGKLKVAEPMFQWALTSYEKTLGPDHHSTLQGVSYVGDLYRRQGKLEKAESMYQRALEGREHTFGLDHLSTIRAINNVGTIYLDQGKLKEAESMYLRALIGYERIFGSDHPYTLAIVSSLGILYDKQGKPADAESMFLRALLGYSRNPPPDPKEQLKLYYNTGLLYQDMQKFEKAKEFFGQAYQGFQELLGPQHDITITSLVHVNIELVRKEQPTAFVSGVISMPVSEGTTEAELWANIEKSVVEKTRVSCAVNTSRARQNDTESEEKIIESQVARISAQIRAYMAEKARKRQARANQPCE